MRSGRGRVLTWLDAARLSASNAACRSGTGSERRARAREPPLCRIYIGDTTDFSGDAT